MEKAWWITALVSGLLAIIIGAIATQVAWASAEEDSTTMHFRMFDAGEDGPGQAEQRTTWGQTFLDGRGGVDLIRPAGPLFVAGLTFMVIALVTMQNRLLFSAPTAQAAVATSAVGAVFMAGAIVLLPLGYRDYQEWQTNTGVLDAAIAWGPGLGIAIAAGVLALTAFTASLVATLKSKSA